MTEGSVKEPSPEDVTFLALTIWGEARGEGRDGMLAVAHVVKNRCERGGWFGSSIREVCLKNFQFSCWNKSDPNSKKLDPARLEKLNPVTPDAAAWRSAKSIAYTVLLGMLKDYTNGATHYHTVDIPKPAWATKLTEVARKGRHIFYR